jgi:hypothetical protein
MQSLEYHCRQKALPGSEAGAFSDARESCAMLFDRIWAGQIGPPELTDNIAAAEAAGLHIRPALFLTT